MKKFKSLFLVGFTIVMIPVGLVIFMSILSFIAPKNNYSESEKQVVYDTIKVEKKVMIYDTVKIVKEVKRKKSDSLIVIKDTIK